MRSLGPLRLLLNRGRRGGSPTSPGTTGVVARLCFGDHLSLTRARVVQVKTERGQRSVQTPPALAGGRGNSEKLNVATCMQLQGVSSLTQESEHVAT